MRVKVFDYTGLDANQYDKGQQIYGLIAPAIARGEPVELDFEGVEWIPPQFLASAVFQLIPVGLGDRVDELLIATNLSPSKQQSFKEMMAGHRKLKATQAAYDEHQRILAWCNWLRQREQGDESCCEPAPLGDPPASGLPCMSGTSVLLSEPTHRALAELAQQLGASPDQVIARALEAYKQFTTAGSPR